MGYKIVNQLVTIPSSQLIYPLRKDICGSRIILLEFTQVETNTNIISFLPLLLYRILCHQIYSLPTAWSILRNSKTHINGHIMVNLDGWLMRWSTVRFKRTLVGYTTGWQWSIGWEVSQKLQWQVQGNFDGKFNWSFDGKSKWKLWWEVQCVLGSKV